MKFHPILMSIAGAVICSLLIANSIRTAHIRQELAYKGDAMAALRIILPCYKPLFRGLFFLFLSFSVALIIVSRMNLQRKEEEKVIQFYSFSLLALYCITPVLFLQSSISFNAFWKTFYTLAPWWLFGTVLWAVSLKFDYLELELLFVYWTALPPMILSIGLLTRLIPSRIQLKSNSNRNTMEVTLMYSVLYCVAYTFFAVDNDSAIRYTVSLLVAMVSLVGNILFPFALYRTLLADTKFWRGMGKHNTGIRFREELETGDDLVRPTIDLRVVSSSLQKMMKDIDDLAIDFAFLQLERHIGDGATAKVYCGRYRTRLCAVKLSNPPEITEEVIEEFVHEARIASSLNHINIVQFLGICVRPPQIAMVFEYCEGGSLKSNLAANRDKWTMPMKYKACLDCAKAIECLHYNGYIHRDLKAENFFVGRKMVVKLGDFGESTRQRSRESAATKRMSIVGTVSFMAPELIAASKHYTEAIDIYALGITFWEIWTGSDPYDGMSHFDIYTMVEAGVRPQINRDIPQEIYDLMRLAWATDPADRPNAKKIVEVISRMLDESTIGERYTVLDEIRENIEEDEEKNSDDDLTDDKSVNIDNPLQREISTLSNAAATSTLESLIDNGDAGVDNNVDVENQK